MKQEKIQNKIFKQIFIFLGNGRQQIMKEVDTESTS